MAPAYLLVEMNISDPDQYRQYIERAPAAVRAAGGEYIVRGGRNEALEGDWQPHRLAVLRFPSWQQAKDFYDGPLYAEARKLRAGATEYFNAVLVEGVEGQP